MKQHINLDDLNQLSDKGKERLSTWYYSTFKPSPDFAEALKRYELQFGHKSLPKEVSIDQLIQFLDEHDFFVGGHVSGTEGQIWHDDRGWALCYLGSDSLLGQRREMLTEQHKELIDSLWMAVKDILEKEG